MGQEHAHIETRSYMCTVANFQNLKVVHSKKFFEEELVEVENGKWKCPHILYYMLTHQMRDLLIHSFYFLVFWLS